MTNLSDREQLKEKCKYLLKTDIEEHCLLLKDSSGGCLDCEYARLKEENEELRNTPYNAELQLQIKQLQSQLSRMSKSVSICECTGKIVFTGGYGEPKICISCKKEIK